MRKDNIEMIKTEHILNVLSAITAAITNIKLYPSASAIITESLEKAYASMQKITLNAQSLVFSESESSLLINGKPLVGKIQKTSHVLSFVSMMDELGVRIISFGHDMGKGDFESMLLLFGKGAEEIEAEGGIGNLLKSGGISGITVETKGYTTSVGVTTDKGQSRPLPFYSGHVPSPAELKKIAVSAENYHWVETFFSSVNGDVQDDLTLIPHGDMAQNISQAIAVLAKSAAYGDSDAIFSNIADTFSSMENGLLSHVFNMNIESGLLDNLIDYVDEERLVNLVSWLHVTAEKKTNGFNALDGAEITAHKANYDYLSRFEKTRGLAGKISERIQKESRWQILRAQKCREGIKDILNGNTDHFSDELIMGSVPGIVGRMFGDGREEEAHKLLDKISEGLLSLESTARDCVSRALYQVGRDLADADKKEEVSRLSGKLNLWLKFEADVFPAYRPVCGLLRDHVKYLIEKNHLAEANPILETFNFNHYGKIQKRDEIREISGEVLKSISTPSLLKCVFNEFRTNEHQEAKHAYFTLVRLGGPSVKPLLDLLQISDIMAERVRVMGALSEIGAPVLPLLVDRINTGASWYYLRNLLKLLGELGSEEHIDVLLPLLGHSNHQVHHAALNCTFDIGGPVRGKFFIAALQRAGETLKIKIVDLMGKLGDEEGVFHLTEILKSRGYDKAHVKNELDEAVCDALGKIGSKKAVPVLKAIIKQKGILGIGSYSADLCKTAALTLEDIARKQSIVSNARPEAGAGTASADVKNEDDLFGSNIQHVGLLKEYIRQDNKAEAVKLLYDMIVISAKAKNFSRAEALRERLFEIDSMALTEILKSGEIIEAEKNQSIANEYMEIWNKLHDKLTDEEANVIYYSTKAMVYEVDSVITRQGDKNARLFFINRGQVKIVYRDDEREYFLKVLGSGEIAGDDTFFPTTVSTTSVVALSQVTVGYLERDDLEALKEKFPSLQKKLIDYCAASVSINDLVTRKGLDRRKHERVKASGKVLTQLLDASGKLLGKPFHGTLSDISMGGVAFKIRTAKEGLGRLLLGRRISMAVGIPTKNSPVQISSKGTILSVRNMEDEFFSIHLGFDEPVHGDVIGSLIENTQ